jgi:hypothetical protein
MKKSERKKLGKSGQNDRLKPLTQRQVDSALRFAERITTTRTIEQILGIGADSVGNFDSDYCP